MGALDASYSPTVNPDIATATHYKDGQYFKDGLDWYFFRYVNPFCERTIFFISFFKNLTSETTG